MFSSSFHIIHVTCLAWCHPVGVCVCVHTCECACAHVETRRRYQKFSSVVLSLISRDRVCYWPWGLLSSARLAIQWACRVHLPLPLMLGLQHCDHAWLFVGTENLNLHRKLFPALVDLSSLRGTFSLLFSMLTIGHIQLLSTHHIPAMEFSFPTSEVNQACPTCVLWATCVPPAQLDDSVWWQCWKVRQSVRSDWCKCRASAWCLSQIDWVLRQT